MEKNYVGKKYGSWEMLAPDDQKDGYYKVKCSCGREKSCKLSTILSGKSTKCRYCNIQKGLFRRVY